MGKSGIKLLDLLTDKEREFLYNRIKEYPHRWKAIFRAEWMKSYSCTAESLGIRNKIGPNRIDYIKGSMVLPPMKLHVPAGIDPNERDNYNERD